MVAPAKALPGVQPSRPTLLLVGLTTGHMVNDFYGTILPPLIPALKDTFTLNYAQVGVLSFCFYILSGILQPAIGHLADKHARRKQAILAGLLIFCAGFVAMGFASSYGFVLAASLLCGLGAASFHPQSTNFLTRAFPQTKGRIMGIHGWGGSIGNFLAPMVMALLIVHFGWRQGLMFLVIPGVLVVLFLRRLLDEPQDRQLASFGKGITRDLLFVALAFSLMSMLLRGFVTFLPTFLVETGSSLNQAGVFTSLMLCVGLIAQPLGGHIYDKVGGRAMFLTCALASGIALLGFTLSTGGGRLGWAALMGFFNFALFPVALAMGSEIAKDNRVGISVGIIFGCSSTLAAFTPLITGHVADLFGLNLAFQLLIVLAAGAACLAFFLPGKSVAATAT